MRLESLQFFSLLEIVLFRLVQIFGLSDIREVSENLLVEGKVWTLKLLLISIDHLIYLKINSGVYFMKTDPVFDKHLMVFPEPA